METRDFTQKANPSLGVLPPVRSVASPKDGSFPSVSIDGLCWVTTEVPAKGHCLPWREACSSVHRETETLRTLPERQALTSSRGRGGGGHGGKPSPSHPRKVEMKLTKINC